MSIEITNGSPSPREAAAVAAAIQQFIAETTPAPGDGPKRNPWQVAALREGIAARQIEPSGWGPAVGR